MASSGGSFSAQMFWASGQRVVEPLVHSAAAVKASLDRDLAPGNTCPLCGPCRNVSSINAADDTHVKINLKKPVAPLIGLLTKVTFGRSGTDTIAQGTDSYRDQENPRLG